MNTYLITYGSENEMATFDAESHDHAIEQFVNWAPVSSDDTTNREAITSIMLCLPLTAADNAVLDYSAGAPDIEWRSKSGDRLWIGVSSISLYIHHNDEGVTVDTYPAGDECAEAIGSIWTEWPLQENCTQGHKFTTDDDCVDVCDRCGYKEVP